MMKITLCLLSEKKGFDLYILTKKLDFKIEIEFFY